MAISAQKTGVFLQTSYLLFVSLLLWSTATRGACALANSEQLKRLGPHDELPRLKVFVVSPPYAGHYLPLLTIASELQSRGHDVTFLAPVQRDNVHVPARHVRDSGVPFWPLGFTPLNNSEIEAIVAQGRNGTNLLGAVKHFLDADVTAYIDIDRLLTSEKPAPDVILACNVFRFMGRRIGHEHKIPVLFNYPVENYFWRPPWPFPVLASGLPDRMTFPERLKNELVSFVNSFLIAPYLLRIELPRIYRKRGVTFEPKSAPPAQLFGMHGAPSILNTAPGFDFPAPLPPSVVQTGPLISTAGQTFPEPLKSWLDSKPSESIILVSLGTVNVIDERVARNIVEGLRPVGKDVLWVLKEEFRGALARLDVPGRFRLEKWIPQKAVLAHRAVAAFVTHCGNNGAQEALANAVPAVGLPFVADQKDVGARLAAAGFPVLDLALVTPSDLTSAVQKVTSPGAAPRDGRNAYQEKARRLARIYRAYGGVKTAADFVEHIAELGSDHLQMAGLSMPWYVRHRLDTGLFALVLLGTVSWGASFVTGGLYRAFRNGVQNGFQVRAKVD